MNSVFLLIAGMILFGLAYRIYGAFVSKKLGIDAERRTPAHTLRDNVDYVPAKKPVLLGHHFASIAGAGPILGPIIASMFGWVPVFIWVVLGGIFLGGMHDFTALVASIRHQGRSIGQVIEAYLGRKGKILFLIFSFTSMLLVVAAFSKIIAVTFVTLPSVATASMLFIIVAVFFGFGIYRRGVALIPATAVGVPLMILCIYLGGKLPLSFHQFFISPETNQAISALFTNGEIPDNANLSVIQHALTQKGLGTMAEQIHQATRHAEQIWIVILLAYVFAASVIPVHLLLQPRDYLNSFLLYGVLTTGIIGAFFAHPTVHMPAFTGFKTELGTLFPVLFVTVACGAISGAHALIASGTTSKQLDKESDAKFIGMGAMYIESILAILAIVAAAGVVQSRYHILYKNGDFITIFSEGIGWIVEKIPLLGISKSIGITFSGLAVSAFTLTTLDTCARIGRFALQELFMRKDAVQQPLLTRNRYLATLVTILLSSLFIFSGSSSAIWPVFGSANQLLAALTLLAVAVWLTHQKQKTLFVVIPMIFMYLVTMTALITLLVQNIHKHHYALVIASGFLLVIALLMALQAWGRLLPVQIKRESGRG